MSFDQKARGKPELEIQVIRAEGGEPVDLGTMTAAKLRRWHADVARRLSTLPAYQPVRDGWDLIVRRVGDEWRLAVNAPGHDLHDTEHVHPHEEIGEVEAKVLAHKQTLDDAHRNGG
jgi:hypothetical protein